LDNAEDTPRYTRIAVRMAAQLHHALDHVTVSKVLAEEPRPVSVPEVATVI
jgi:hypothetical protein